MNLKLITIVASGAFVALGGNALAQTSPSQGSNMQQMPTQSGQMLPSHSGRSMLRADAKQFMTKSAQDSLLEFASAELAVQKAQNPQVAQYGLRLIDDHAQYNKQLMLLARQKGVVLPVELDSQGKSKLERLMKLQGAAFDQQFIQKAVQANASDLDDLQRASRTLKDADVQAFITQVTPTQQQHLQISKELQSGTSASTTRPMGMMGK